MVWYLYFLSAQTFHLVRTFRLGERKPVVTVALVSFFDDLHFLGLSHVVSSRWP